MFNVLADVAVIREFTISFWSLTLPHLIGEDGLVYYLEEVPVLALHQFKS